MKIQVKYISLVAAISHKNVTVTQVILNIGDILLAGYNNFYISEAAILEDYFLIKDLITVSAEVYPSFNIIWERSNNKLKSDSPLTNAAKYGDIKMAKFLLNSGANIN